MSRQINLFGEEYRETAITNVASIPQRSPFRYPGGENVVSSHCQAMAQASRPAGYGTDRTICRWRHYKPYRSI
ncbi:MAG: hypothetical protein LBF89_02800 [Bacteroidales bacterium]|jgi:hypothetical protein|nr:hypothetical protein [Bacteroidales bacterium]